MEILLRVFKENGMTDLSFVIVNAKDMLSQMLRAGLEERVSFPVYQATDDNDIWEAMEGGKDDMYIYDRCGRLAFYIPFPLSIMSSEQTLVQTAIIATYFHSPCGSTCGGNGTFLDDLIINTTNTYEEQDSLLQNPEGAGVLIDVEDFNQENNTPNNQTNNMLSNTYNSSTNSVESVIYTNDTETIEEQAGIHNETESQRPEKQGFFSSMYSFFSKSNPDDKPAEEHDSHSTELSTTTDNINSEVVKDHHHKHHGKEDDALEKIESEKVKPKPDEACFGVEENVCRSWSKRRLFHAQKCCSGTHTTAEDSSTHRHQRNCRVYGKKRCKKIQVVIKCCLKTAPPSEETISHEAAETTTRDPTM